MQTDKRTAIDAQSHTRPGVQNRLFFAARNLAIEAVLLRLENLLLREGFNAKCAWRESSFGGPTLDVMMLNPKPSENSWEYGTCRLIIKRDIIAAPDDWSSCFYTLTEVQETEYWPGREPAKLLAFRARIKELGEQGLLAAEVMKVNFPFEYNSNSSF